MQITEQIIERIARKVFNAMFPQALRSSNVVTGSGGGGSVQHAVEADHATTADSATTAGSADAVAWSGVSNKPDTATRWPAWSEVTGKPNFAAVATSGSYNDLSNKPTIPTVPSNVSAFNNDAGYITSSGSCSYATSAGSTGYATNAGDADTLDGNHASYFINTGGGQTIANNLKVASVKIEATNEINSYTGQLHLNYRVSTGVTLCIGGGNVGIGTTSPSQKLSVSGRIACTSGFSFQSDIRKKNVIDREVKLSIDNIADAPLIHYTLKDGADKDNHVGSVAQYWATVLPETVQKDKQGYLSMQYDVQALASAVVLAREMRELKKQIEELRNEHKQ